MLQDKHKEIEEVRQRNRSTISAIHTQHQKARDAVSGLKTQKRDMRDESVALMTEVMKRKEEEDAHNLAKKQEVIKMVHQHEQIPISRFLGYDPTENGGHGLMCEMSVAELRERIELNKTKLQQEVEFKRDKNLASKEREAITLTEEAMKVEQARLKRKQAGDERRENNRKQAEDQER